ncbi:MAG: hypothetical protein K6G03_11065 [Lachnospiraceae bacterium]|nr:hypothetical protein [Lachnospiraceae bacterium]
MKIDERTAEDIESRIKELAASYTPEWHFDTKDPDIGAVIAHLFSLQMKENIDLENQMLEKYHTAFINMLDLSLQPAKPAGSMVKFDLIENTVPGIYIRKGTRLVAEALSSDGDQITFETERELYVTNSRIVDAFMTDREDGTFIPLLGDYSPVSFVDGIDEVTDDEELSAGVNEDETETTEGSGRIRSIKPFTLFSEEGNIARSALVIYHENLFDIEDEPIYIRLKGNEELVDDIADGKYLVKYYSKKGYRTFDSVKKIDDSGLLELKKREANRHLLIGNKSYAAIIIESVKTVREDKELTGIELSSSGKERNAEFVSSGTDDLDINRFAPFSEELSVYNECYIGQDVYFAKGGSEVTLSFHTEYKERGLYLTKQEEEANLKIIKRKPKIQPADVPADAYADEIVLEYFNGTGWRKLICEDDVTGLFANPVSGDYVISFICPADWKESQIGAFSGRAIRMRLMRADNCFLRPGIHHYPVISKLKISFSYEDNFADPARLCRVEGTNKKLIPTGLKTGESFIALSNGGYAQDALYLGFSLKIEGGPVSLYFELDDVLNMTALKCVYEYSNGNGFKRMKVVDNTRFFLRSGSVIFIPPSDMSEEVIEGKKRYWIRIRREKAESGAESALFLPKIRRIMMNVVNVSNIITGTEENFYLNDTLPNQRFTLPASNILDADVWVNERGSISKEEVERLQGERPDDIKTEYDILGNLAAVYIRWHETSSFLSVTDRRCYMIDRVTNEIIFSDGIKADTPKVTDDVSFKVRVRSTDGELGNVVSGAINSTAGTEIYLDSVSNPVRAYGGSNLETTAEALRRGANLIYGRERLVSVSDYKYTILSYSDSIDKVACVQGMTIDGHERPSDITFVLLMKDYKEGSFSFHRIAAPLKKHLLDMSSMTLSADHIFIVEPIFVSISVNLWVEVSDMDDSFEIQNLIKETLSNYFNPVSGPGDEGWNIGVIPKKSQIQMRLSSVRSKALIKNMAMVAFYVDKDGKHEMDMDELKVSPFMVVRSGEHQVNVIYK